MGIRWRRTAGMVAMAATALALVACGGGGGEEAEHRAAKVEEVAGTGLSRVTLTEEAARRIDLHTAPVAASSGAAGQVPYSAVLYDPEGKTWVFVDQGSHSFMRAPITVRSITGNTAVLTTGPPVGTMVVTVGGAQLYGAEIGVGDE